MYKVSEYSNNDQESDDASMKEENNAIEIDSGDILKDNDYNMSADEDMTEKPADHINEGQSVDNIDDELLSSGDEDLDAEMHKIGTGDGGDTYRNSVIEFNSEDEIENLEEDEQTFVEEMENINEDEKSGYLSNDSVVELDELNNFEDHDDVQEIPPPTNNLLYETENNGFKNQETVKARKYEDFVNENDQDEDNQNENNHDENNQDESNQDEDSQVKNTDKKIRELGVNSSVQQEIFEELNKEDSDEYTPEKIKETEESDVKHEKEKDDDEKEEQEEKKEEKEEEKVEEEKNVEEEDKDEEEYKDEEEERDEEEQHENDDENLVHEQAGNKEVHKSENSTYGEIIENNNDEKDEYRPDINNTPANSNITIQSKIPNSKLECTFPIIINIAETDFLLVPFDKHRNPEIDVSHLVSLYDDNEILKLTIEEFFGLMRTNEDLNEIHQFTVNKELVLVIPELNLSITEDNIYSRDITIEDFIVSFENLKSNSINEGEELAHKSISFLLTSQTRFITNFNNLTESIRRGKGFNCIGLIHSVFEPIIPSEAPTEDSHKRQSLDSSDEADTQQVKRAKVSI